MEVKDKLKDSLTEKSKAGCMVQVKKVGGALLEIAFQGKGRGHMLWTYASE